MVESSWQASEELWLLARSKLVAKDFAAPSDERVVDAWRMHDHLLHLAACPVAVGPKPIGQVEFRSPSHGSRCAAVREMSKVTRQGRRLNGKTKVTKMVGVRQEVDSDDPSQHLQELHSRWRPCISSKRSRRRWRQRLQAPVRQKMSQGLW